MGGTSFVLDTALLYVFHEVWGMDLVVASGIAFWVAVIYNFSLSRAWTFGQVEKIGVTSSTILYAGLLLFNFLATIILVPTLSLFMYFVFAKTIVVALQTAWNYPLYKYAVFAKRKST